MSVCLFLRVFVCLNVRVSLYRRRGDVFRRPVHLAQSSRLQRARQIKQHSHQNLRYIKPCSTAADLSSVCHQLFQLVWKKHRMFFYNFTKISDWSVHNKLVSFWRWVWWWYRDNGVIMMMIMKRMHIIIIIITTTITWLTCRYALSAVHTSRVIDNKVTMKTVFDSS